MRYRRRDTGVVVDVRDDKPMGREWEPLESASGSDGYESLTVAELRDEIDRRNEGRDAEGRLPSDGKKADLIATLEADDE